MQQQPTVFVVDDDPAIRESLTWLLETVGLKAEAYDSAGEFLRQWTSARPGCLLLDVRMPGMSGVELLDQLRLRGAVIPVIIITAHAEVRLAVRAMKAGALDFIEKPYSDQVLLDRVQQALKMDADERRSESFRAIIQTRAEQLTPREKQVMSLVVEGLSNRRIASDLGLSEKTIEVHRSHVMIKMQAESLAELVRMAIQLDSQLALPSQPVKEV
ncbi:MAG: response regulator transcription factor [Phycisphaeraceae bacterium]|nr:response regulator transcription factor [Phycisphaeraceae bacterium]